MASEPLLINDAFRAAATMQLRRHHLLAADREDDPSFLEIETLLPEMLDMLDDAQIRSLNGLVSDLNWARRKGSPAPKGTGRDGVTQRDIADFARALQFKDAHEVLRILRICGPAIRSDSVAYARARAYLSLGLEAVAGVFFDFLSVNADREELALHGLNQLAKQDRAAGMRRANAVLANPAGYHPLVVAYAVIMLIEEARYDVLLPVITMACDQFDREPHSGSNAGAFYRLIGVFYHIGRDLESALKFYKKGLRFWPASPTLHTGIGLVHYAKGRPEKALYHLRRATKRKSLTAAPYLALITHYFRRGEYAKSLDFAKDGWPNAYGDPEKGTLLAWMAVCRHELGAGPDEVIGLFDRALELRPDSESISANRRAYLNHRIDGVSIEWPQIPQVATRPDADTIESEDLVLVE